MAHRLAQIKASHVRADTGHLQEERADVPAMLAGHNLELAAERGTLLGAYIPPRDTIPPGVWINAGHSVSTQRHTAAHELGHHVFDHGATSDDTIASVTGGHHTSNLTETVAEAFASWLLMPGPALRRAIELLGRNLSTLTPQDVYQTALVLGTSYRGTARQFGVAKLVASEISSRLQRAAPAKIKDGFDDPTAPERPLEANVWTLSDYSHAGRIVLAEGDRLLLDARAEESARRLIDSGIADFVHEGLTHLVLTARRPETAAVAAGPTGDCEISLGPHGCVPLRVQVEVQVRSAQPSAVPMVRDATEDELDRQLGL